MFVQCTLQIDELEKELVRGLSKGMETQTWWMELFRAASWSDTEGDSWGVVEDVSKDVKDDLTPVLEVWIDSGSWTAGEALVEHSAGDDELLAGRDFCCWAPHDGSGSAPVTRAGKTNVNKNHFKISLIWIFYVINN